jgi:cell wall-associated NlpC family hydrolase
VIHRGGLLAGCAAAVMALPLAVVLLVAGTATGGAAAGQAAASGVLTVTGHPGLAGAAAIAYARQQLGKPYLWGGTGPGAFDCSGLVMEAYKAAGILIQRTSQEQWASEAHIPATATPQPGWLVFFAGSDGTPAAPGHVALVTGPHTMIQAYATGYPVMVSSFGAASSLGGTGAGTVVGFTDPAAQPRAP